VVQIIAFVSDVATVRAILVHLGEQTAPPSAEGPRPSALKLSV
jgi:hypothetical protein